jgi:uncharacterized damage-inducible protein DinB
MQTDQAMFMLQAMLPVYENEASITRKVIAAVPDEKKDYRPDDVSRSAAELVWHTVSAEMWFLNGIADANFPQTERGQPENVKTIEQIVAWYDESRAEALARLRGMSAEQLAAPIDFYGVLKLPAISYLGFALNHTIHHRGQLSVYLRPMGAKVPSIYGGSFDEPFQAAAAN